MLHHKINYISINKVFFKALPDNKEGTVFLESQTRAQTVRGKALQNRALVETSILPSKRSG
jgi:hypothetical protein